MRTPTAGPGQRCRRSLAALAAAMACSVAGASAPAHATSMPLAPHSARIVAQAPCPASDFECITVQVPLDHANPGGASTTVVFGVLPAKDPARRKGIFVTAVGGPGASGLSSADSYAAGYDPAINEVFDLVFFDQRGIGMSGALRCDDDVAAYYQTESRTDTAEQERATIEHARAFARDCQARLGDATALKHYGTRQAAADLEAFRALRGEDVLWLYGESYGTQLAQVYAAAYPERVAGLVLDSVVDLMLSGPRFLREQTAAFSDTLARTLEACNADPACRADFGRDALSAYDRLAARLERAPLAFDFRRADGGVDRRTLKLGDLETAASTYLYDPGDRMLLQRALAYAEVGELQPLALLFYASLGLDPQMLRVQPDPSYSDATYYAVNCNDYRYFTGSPDERARGYMQSGDKADREIARMNSVYYGDLPCVFWASGEPAPFDAARAVDVPTLVLVATADPATPANQGREVFRRLNNAALIVQQNGPHVIFGRGDRCIDAPVTAFLLDGALPAQKETRCAGEIVDTYMPIAPARAQRFDSVLDALISAEREIMYDAGYYAWGGGAPLEAACLRGGAITFDRAARGPADLYALDHCAFSAGFVMSGSGRFQFDRDRFTLTVDVRGDAAGALEYVRNGSRYRVTGTLDGQKIDLSR